MDRRIEAERCDDCIATDSAVTDLEPSQQLAIPAEALENGPASARGMTRRQALRSGLLGLASVYAANQLPWEMVWEAVEADAAIGMQRSVVLLYLQGGADSLNMFIPTEASQYSAYAAARANIARTAADYTVMGSTGNSMAFANRLVSGAANNGAPVGLDTLFGDGSGGPGSDLAVFPAADYFPPNLSHFESRDFWFAGSLQKMTTGWVGRWLDHHGSDANPLQAVSLSSSLSKQLRSSRAPVCAIEGLSRTAFGLESLPTRPVYDVNAAIRSLSQVPVAGANPHLRRSRGIYGLTTDVSTQLRTVTHTPGAGYPMNSWLGRQLQLTATLLGAGLGTRFVTIDWGSFDTHGSQNMTMDPQLQELSQSLAAFKADLAARGIEQNVLTLVFSEFGRRVGSNDSAGTDHGAGGAMLVSGSAVRGGLAGQFPGVQPGQLDDNGDLRPATDFRTVYQAILAEWLGTDPAEILPAGPFPAIDRYDGGHALLKAA